MSTLADVDDRQPTMGEPHAVLGFEMAAVVVGSAVRLHRVHPVEQTGVEVP